MPYGVRNPQRFAGIRRPARCSWPTSARTRSKKITPVTAGRESRLECLGGQLQVRRTARKSARTLRGAIRKSPIPSSSSASSIRLLQNSSAVTMGYVYRHSRMKQLANLLIFGDNPSRRNLLRQRRQAAKWRAGCDPPHSLQRQRPDENAAAACQGKECGAGQEARATRADLRFGEGPDGADLHPQQVGRSDPGDRALTREDVALSSRTPRLCAERQEREAEGRGMWPHDN